MGKNLKHTHILDMITYYTDDDTLIIDFRCSSVDKEVSYTVAKTISEKAPDYVEKKLNRINLNPVDSVNKNVFGTTKPTLRLQVSLLLLQ